MKIHEEIWVAAALLHEAGRTSFSLAELKSEVKRLFDDERQGVTVVATAHANASANRAAPTVYNYLLRVERGSYRLCRKGDPVHESRAGAPLWPEQAGLHSQFWPLWRRWTAWQAEAGPAPEVIQPEPEPAPVAGGGTLDQLITYIRSRPGLEIRRSPAAGSGHMGAVIAEGILQGGVSYRHTVVPRVSRILERYPDAATTSAFLALLEREGADRVLQIHGRKAPWVLNLLQFFQRSGVETVSDLQRWLVEPASADLLLEQPGVGKKTVSYLRILAGLEGIAVDRHPIRFLQEAGIAARSYAEHERWLMQAAGAMGVAPAALDYGIWAYMSGGAGVMRRGRPPGSGRPRSAGPRPVRVAAAAHPRSTATLARGRTFGGDSMLVGLISCTKAKLPRPAPAGELYSPSHLFQGARRSLAGRADLTYILSAKYGLVLPDQEIAPYDQTLKALGRAERERWARQVFAELVRRHGEHMSGITFEFHAGSAYQDDLEPLLRAAGATCISPVGGMTIGRRLQFYASSTLS